MNFTRNNAFCLNLNASFREDHTIESARNHHAIPFNLSLNLRAFTQDDRLLRDDVAFHIAVDAERARNGKCSLQGYALIDEPGPLFADSALCCAGPLPRH